MKNKYKLRKGTKLYRDTGTATIIEIVGDIVFKKWRNPDGSLGKNWETLEQINHFIDEGIDEVGNE